MVTAPPGRRRVLGWESCLNVRDLGGYPTAAGGVTQWGVVVRSDNPAKLTPAGVAAARAYGVTTIVDLRLPDEIEAHPNPLVGNGSGIDYVQVSLIDPGVPAGRMENVTDLYISSLERFPDRYAAAVDAVGQARPGCVMINCMAGKDRTGMLSAFLLSIAAVSHRIIAEDYELTTACLRPMDQEYLLNGPGARSGRERELRLWAARATVMLDVLGYLDERYDGAEGFLRHAGVRSDTIDSIRRRLVTVGGAEDSGD